MLKGIFFCVDLIYLDSVYKLDFLSYNFLFFFCLFVNLFVVPPEVEGSEITHNMTAIQNEPFEMVCETDESIPAKIAWYHNGRKLRKYDQGRSISKTGTVLTLQNPQREDRGDYYCEVSNQAGSERKHFSVDIYGERI